MLPKKHRVTVQTFYKNPTTAFRLFSPSLQLSIKKTADSPFRLTVVVPKSLDKRSTRRNQTKRIVRECIRPWLLELHAADVKLRMKRILQKTDRSTIEQELAAILRKAGLLT